MPTFLFSILTFRYFGGKRAEFSAEPLMEYNSSDVWFHLFTWHMRRRSYMISFPHGGIGTRGFRGSVDELGTTSSVGHVAWDRTTRVPQWREDARAHTAHLCCLRGKLCLPLFIDLFSKFYWAVESISQWWGISGDTDGRVQYMVVATQSFG